MKIDIDDNLIAEAMRSVATSALGQYEFRSRMSKVLATEMERAMSSAVANVVASELPGFVRDELEQLARKAVRKAVRDGQVALPMLEKEGM